MDLTNRVDDSEIESEIEPLKDGYLVYNRRWLMLFASFNLLLVFGLYSWYQPIIDVLREHLNISMDLYNFMTEISMYTTILSVLILGRALEQYGLRRMFYTACVFIICNNVLKIICLMDASPLPQWIVANRYYIFLVSEVFTGLLSPLAFCIPAKLANEWFPSNENASSQMLAGCGYNLGCCVAFFIPMFIEKPADLSKMNYLFVLTALSSVLIVACLVTSSKPKRPPSIEAELSASSIRVPFFRGALVMLTNRSFFILIMCLAFNNSLIIVEYLELQDILAVHQYTNTFCGSLISANNFLGIFFLVLGGILADGSDNLIRLSRFVTIFYAITMIIFNISINYNIHKVLIVIMNIVISLGYGLFFPALLKLSLNTSLGVMAESSVMSLTIILYQSISALISMTIQPMRRLGNGHYTLPLGLLSMLVLLINLLYSLTFVEPDTVGLRRKLQTSRSRESEV